MSKKVYVGNMSYSTTEEELQTLFGEYGNVMNINIITDRYTNQPKGFAFVEMEAEDAAQAAISALNNTEVNGRTLRVNEAFDNKSRPKRNRY